MTESFGAALSPSSPIASRTRQRRRFTARILSLPGQKLAWSILFLLVSAAVLAPVLAPHSPNVQDLTSTLAPPNGEHLLGTDDPGSRSVEPSTVRTPHLTRHQCCSDIGRHDHRATTRNAGRLHPWNCEYRHCSGHRRRAGFAFIAARTGAHRRNGSGGHQYGHRSRLRATRRISHGLHAVSYSRFVKRNTSTAQP